LSADEAEPSEAKGSKELLHHVAPPLPLLSGRVLPQSRQQQQQQQQQQQPEPEQQSDISQSSHDDGDDDATSPRRDMDASGLHQRATRNPIESANPLGSNVRQGVPRGPFTAPKSLSDDASGRNPAQILSVRIALPLR
jgi:hypothetical protein